MICAKFMRLNEDCASASLLIQTKNPIPIIKERENEVIPLEYQIGQVVYSKSGHDRGDVQMIFSIEGDYLYLVDGKRRKLAKPKRKKKKHVQPTSFLEAEVAEKLQQKCYLPDAEIAKALKKYQKEAGSQ